MTTYYTAKQWRKLCRKHPLGTVERERMEYNRAIRYWRTT